MAPVHLWRLSWDWLNLDADLLALLGTVNGLVIYLDAGDHTDVHKLTCEHKGLVYSSFYSSHKHPQRL